MSSDAISACLASLGEGWGAYSFMLFWQVALVVAVAWVLTRLLRRGAANFRYAIWILVIVRLLLPADLSLPSGVGSLAEPYLHEVRLPLVIPSSGENREPISPAEASSAGASVWFPANRALPEQGASPVWIFSTGTTADSLAPGTFLESLGLAGTLFGIWVSGLGLLGLLVVVRSVHLRRRLSRARPILEGEVYQLFVRSREKMDLPPFLSCGLFECDAISSPLASGIFRARLMLPSHLLKNCSLKQLEPLVLHELAHVKRYDLLVNWIQVVLQILHWYNPLVWFANARIKETREEACDDQALALTSYTRKNYASSLIKVLELTPRRPALYSGYAGMIEAVETESFIARRLHRIVGTRKRFSTQLSFFRGLMLLFLASVLLPAMPPPRAERKPLNFEITESAKQSADVPLKDSSWEKEMPKEEGSLLTQVRKKEIGIAKNDVLSVFVEDDAVLLRGWEKPTLGIRATIQVAGPGEPQDMSNALDNIKPGVNRVGNIVVVSTTFMKEKRKPGQSVTYELDVPNGIFANIQTENAGIQAKNVRGIVNLKTTRGDIRLETMEGVINASSVSGGISARGIRGKASLVCSAGTVSVEQTNGSLYVVNMGGGASLVGVHGDIEVCTHKGNISLIEGSGNVHLRVKHGGRIEARDVEGSCLYKTDLDGDIEIVRNKAFVRLESLRCVTRSGNIRLSLPRDVSLELDAQTDGGVLSDFALGDSRATGDNQIAGKIRSGGAKVNLLSNVGEVSVLALHASSDLSQVVLDSVQRESDSSTAE